MSYYNFDGEFRRMPQQSLGGASKVEDRSELIRRAQFERQKREVGVIFLTFPRPIFF